MVRWWFDTSYKTHNDFRVHNGVVIILGRGTVLRSSLKQKLNVKSSIERELVGAHYGPIMVFWRNNSI